MKNENKLSPILFFVYNRPYHTKQTIEALQKNELASDSKLYIYSDAPKNESAKQGVEEVRSYIKSIDGFKDITIIEREKNFGLADSIINGVTKIVNRYGKVIVLEDDLVTSPYFLRFMNEALEFYEYEKRVWHISGWNYPIDTKELDDVFLWRVMNCWGWATWKDRWEYYEKNIDRLVEKFSKDDIYKFNLDGVENFWSQVLANRDKKINTWAIFWYATIFKRNGLSLNPAISYVRNIGHDSSGVHCGESDFQDNVLLNDKDKINFNIKLVENEVAVNKIKDFFIRQKNPLFIRVVNKFSRTVIGKNIIK